MNEPSSQTRDDVTSVSLLGPAHPDSVRELVAVSTAYAIRNRLAHCPPRTQDTDTQQRPEH